MAERRWRGAVFALAVAAPLVVGGCAGLAVGGAAAGVAAVHDRRTIGTLLDDQAIELKVRKALLEDPELRERVHVEVTAFNGVVLLTGEVPEPALHQRVVQIVRRQPKVRRVVDELAEAAPSALTARTSDTLLTGKVKARLLADRRIDGTRIKVVTDKGVVYLMGLVTRAEADRATEVARRVGGVQKVVRVFEYLDDGRDAAT